MGTDGEAVRLVPEPLQEIKHRVPGIQGDRWVGGQEEPFAPGAAQGLGLAAPAAQASVRVNVALPAANALPTRFAPEDAEESTGSGATSWWRSLLKPLPFN